jgi:hypothetical protein
MIITKDGYIINYKKRETLELISAFDNTSIDGISYTTFTLPKFLKIIDDTNPEKVVIYDYLKLINSEMSFSTIYEISQNFNLNAKDIFLSYIYIKKNKYISYIEQQQGDYIELILLSDFKDNFTTNESELTKKLIDSVTYNNIKDEISYELINEIDKQILTFKNNMKNYIKNIFPLTQIKPLPYTEFIKEEENINLIFNNDLSLYTIFDNIILSSFFPFSSFNKYVKIYNKLEINKVLYWNSVDYSTMTIKKLLQIAKEKQIYIVNNKKINIINKLKEHDISSNLIENKIVIKHLTDKKYVNKKSNLDSYKEITITNKNNKLIVNITINRQNKDYLINMIISLLNLKSYKYTTDINFFNGKFFFINPELQYLNYSIFSHISTHTPYYIKINEFINASTKSNTIKIQYTEYKNIDSSLKNNIVTNINSNNNILNKYENGTYFIEVNILYCDNLDKLNFYINDLGIMLQIYINQFQNLLLFYQTLHTQLNSTFNLDKNKPQAVIYNKDDITTLVNDKTENKSLSPYTKVCSKLRKSHLKINNSINFNDLEKIYPDFNDFFFKNPDDTLQYMLWPKGDVDSYLLSCDDENNHWIYPGVTKDSYYPCCFSENQISTNVKNDHKPSIKSYYYDMEKDTSVSYNIKGTKKLLTQEGKTADLLTNILVLVGDNSKRKSVKLSKTSFVDCIKNHPTLFNLDSVEDVDKTLIISKQSNYNISIDKIKEKLENNTIDCRNFTTFFEYIFNIYIITFDYDGHIIIPNHLNGYIDFYFDKNIIFLYENLHNNKPQYEYIINTKNDLDFNSILKHRFSFFSLHKQILPFIQLPFIDLVDSQYIDQYGKCSVIKIIFDDNEIFAQTFLPPLLINHTKTLDSPIITFTNLLVLQKFIYTYSIETISQYIFNNNCVELSCKINAKNTSIQSDIILTFKLNSEQIFTNLPYHDFPKIISSQDFLYQNFVKLQKISKSLQQYCLYLFSLISISFEDFFKKHIIFKPPTHSYIISKNFKNNTFIENNKLIISGKDDDENIEIVQRLKSYITLFFTRKHNTLKNYKDKTIIDQLYLTLSDFKHFKNQYLFISDNISFSQQKLIFTSPSSFNINSYFILFNNTIFLTTDTISISNAIYISNTWLNHKYNYMKNDKFSPINDYIIFDLLNNIKEKKGNHTHTILFRIHNNTPIFSPLLTF